MRRRRSLHRAFQAQLVSLDQFRPERYLAADDWMMRQGFLNQEDAFRHQRVVMTLLLGKRVVSRGRASVWLSYFLLLGAGFMVIEIAMIQRAGLLFGNPGLSIAVVLCLVILSTGLGALLSEKTFARGWTIRQVALGVAGYGLILGLVSETLLASALGAPLPVRLAVVALVIVPGGLIMGQLFPQGLARAGTEDRSLAPWAWGINGAMSAAAAGIAPLIAQAAGFTALFVLGAGLYALAALLPVERRVAVEDALPDAAE
ncbi:hypothetical protein [Litorisediminicola beolgyonensis]|uniref:MFS transporter n=1 Tax=Litorisediminicola beolgyonensis TaxID=1173614 RepID=A0ABW3ZPA1_9RHOB